MAKVLVSGAGGYIGIPLCRKILEQGHELIALDRYFFGKQRLADIEANPKAKVVVDDIRSFDPGLLKGVEIVLDLAGLSNDASAEIDPQLTQSINCDGGRRLARIAKEAGVRRYIYSSSASVYGNGVQDQLKETDECRPLTLYAESKLRVEEELAKLNGSGFEPVIFRTSTVFGLAPRMRFDLAINVMTLRAWKERVVYIMGGGQQWRPFIHVNDVVRAFVMATEQPAEKVSGQTFNLGSDDMVFQIGQLAQFVLDVIPNVTVHRIPDDTDKRSYNVSFTKIRDQLGFISQTRVHEGVVEIKQALERGTIESDSPTQYTLQWYRSLLDWEARIKELSLNGKVL
ncbi:MAG: family oxidoreductase [Cyanobacteriota bacterium erpe_2018_sw_21hr_WHONDRS-SW48-000092_B_bin.40]|jgi:nucleoside-diphosphate-sugar epimerase|nr:family oxidoreductase [Cyanobacteriota bacterium erpe_2018_sw_21hr_WHONDRS-SW48-000092_B_bin.40]